MMGLEARTFLSICVSAEAPPTEAKYLMAYLALTVFPAPLSPLTMMDWLQCSLCRWQGGGVGCAGWEGGDVECAG